MPDTLEFTRPLGVVGGPHVGDVIGDPVLPDLSFSEEPASEHFRNAQQLVQLVEFCPPDCQAFILHAINERVVAALKALAERRFTTRSGAHMGIAG